MSCGEAARARAARAPAMARIWSPSTSSPVASTARQRSASPSWAMPTSAPCATTACLQRSRGRRAAAVVDAHAVAVGADRDDLGARLAQHPRRERGRRPLGAVDDDLQRRRAGSSGRSAGGGRSPRPCRPGPGTSSRSRPTPAPVGRLLRRGGRRRASMRSSTSSASLKPPLPKILIPLSGIGVVAGRQHDAEVGTAGRDGVGDRRGRHHAEPDDVGAGAREARRDGRLEQLAGGPGVAADDDRRTRRPAAP